MSAYDGAVPVRLGEQDYTLRFDWAALAEVKQAHGDEPDLLDLSVLASVASLGFRARHPELTPERLAELSPPVWPLTRAIQQAYRWAYFGPEEPTTGEPGPASPATGWRGLFRRRAAAASTPSSSGG